VPGAEAAEPVLSAAPNPVPAPGGD